MIHCTKFHLHVLHLTRGILCGNFHLQYDMWQYAQKSYFARGQVVTWHRKNFIDTFQKLCATHFQNFHNPIISLGHFEPLYMHKMRKLSTVGHTCTVTIVHKITILLIFNAKKVQTGGICALQCEI